MVSVENMDGVAEQLDDILDGCTARLSIPSAGELFTLIHERPDDVLEKLNGSVNKAFGRAVEAHTRRNSNETDKLDPRTVRAAYEACLTEEEVVDELSYVVGIRNMWLEFIRRVQVLFGQAFDSECSLKDVIDDIDKHRRKAL